ncbi:hypothetical protein LPB19_04685 [Marinobacter salinisoli]|uniref:23S rRNA (Adenine(2503)-C(2))-methyltransferase RlmN n=1 Tax=Marinobacter salinisoli TaxID=2769486 RepID=A0ABX7MTL1_9GAMM|nr:hypothetical protein [Marinobacter salinisoli]QSP95715.1 hypothetical protein LPB19_04685 [Marinobacter salinisoli]
MTPIKKLQHSTMEQLTGHYAALKMGARPSSGQLFRWLSGHFAPKLRQLIDFKQFKKLA